MSDLFIDKFATDDELVNECLADHVAVGTNLFEDVLVLKERIAELEEDKERLLLMEEHAVQSFNELTRKYEAMEQQLAELREGIRKLVKLDADIASTLDLELEMKLEAEFACVLMGLAARLRESSDETP